MPTQARAGVAACSPFWRPVFRSLPQMEATLFPLGTTWYSAAVPTTIRQCRPLRDRSPAQLHKALRDAIVDGTYPLLWNNDLVDASFGHLEDPPRLDYARR